MSVISVNLNPEFGCEIALGIPYVYWLHLNGKLEKVITSKGMKPFYYFCDNVEEKHTIRTIDNSAAGLDTLPNNWIHHNAVAVFGKDYSELTEEEQSKANGVLDYSKWELPPYLDHYKNTEFKWDKSVMVINKYNIEHQHEPYGFFDFQSLVDIFTYLNERGYTVIYKRQTNKESGIAVDINEIDTINNNLDFVAEVEGVGTINDHQLTKYFEDVILFDDLVDSSSNYNEIQMKVMANVDGFITPCGGNSILSSIWKKPILCYITQGYELRPDYFSEDSYIQKMSDNNLIPIFDIRPEINKNTYDFKVNNSGKNDYQELIKKMKETWL